MPGKGKSRRSTRRSGRILQARSRTPHVASRRDGRHVFGFWAEIGPQIQAAKHLAIFLDFDGTLTPIRPRPEMVRLSAPTRRLIRRLAQLQDVTICIVSGRRLADLRRRAGVAGARYIGLHGAEHESREPVQLENESLKQVKCSLEEKLSAFPGIRLEDKRLTLAVHFRGASSGVVRKAGAAMRRTLELFGPRLCLLKGKKVWEILPPGVTGKGSAVRRVIAKLPRGTLPIYIGDDTTDESAFAELCCGITIIVGRRRHTHARFYVRDPDEVVVFLQALEVVIS